MLFAPIVRGVNGLRIYVGGRTIRSIQGGRIELPSENIWAKGPLSLFIDASLLIVCFMFVALGCAYAASFTLSIHAPILTSPFLHTIIVIFA